MAGRGQYSKDNIAEDCRFKSAEKIPHIEGNELENTLEGLKKI